MAKAAPATPAMNRNYVIGGIAALIGAGVLGYCLRGSPSKADMSLNREVSEQRDTIDARIEFTGGKDQYKMVRELNLKPAYRK